ncbi:MAG: hypothetical protein V3V22_11190, partial [Methylococcales bacterium]
MISELDNSQNFEDSLNDLGQLVMDEQAINRQVRCLFSRSQQHSEHRIYLANHSLGRALDQTELDVLEGLSYWYCDSEKAWESWLTEINAFRSCVAKLI